MLALCSKLHMRVVINGYCWSATVTWFGDAYLTHAQALHAYDACARHLSASRALPAFSWAL
jgi:hypothetical protein